MKIGIIGSLQFLDEYTKVSKALEKEGHEVYLSKYIEAVIDKDVDVDKYKEQIKENYILDFWNEIQDADAIVVLNYDKLGIKDYIGGSTLIGMSFAHVLGQTIYFMNPIPIVQNYFDEILHMKPIILNGDLSAIPKTRKK